MIPIRQVLTFVFLEPAGGDPTLHVSLKYVKLNDSRGLILFLLESYKRKGGSAKAYVLITSILSSTNIYG